jgi:hypothetical protein
MTSISKLYQQLQEGQVTREKFSKHARAEYPQYVTNVNSFNDIVSILKNKRIIEEAHKLNTYQIIDRLNPYAVKKGIECELAKIKVVQPGDLDKVREKVAKNLQRNPDFYREYQQANAKEVKKSDKFQDMEEVRTNNFKDKDNQMKKPKGFTPDKANTKASKKENRKGTPKGVKLMKEDMGGMPTPQPVNYKNQEVTINVDPETKEKLSEPKTGVVKEQHGSILEVDFGDGKMTELTINMINKEPEEDNLNAPKEDDFNEPVIREETPKIKEIVSKLKEYLKKKKGLKKGIKDEATEFTIGGKQKYVKDQDAAATEKELRDAGVTKITKRRVQ